MPNYTSGSTRVSLEQPDLTTFLNNGSVVLDSRRARPLWFDGRFMAARDLEREQNYFLQRQADLAQASGFESLRGLMVERGPGTGTVIIRAGDGYTPADELVTIPNDLTVRLSDIPEEQIVDVQFGISTAPAQPTSTRTGLYVIALQPVEYTGNPIGAFPTTVQGPRTNHDGDIIAATAVTLKPYPSPPTNFAASMEQAALARQIFVSGNPSTLPDSVLPLALVSLNAGAIQWIDPYLVRRDIGAQSAGVRFGLADPAIQQAYLNQYDAQLQSVIATRQANGQKANISAADFFQALPPAGRFPLDAIDTAHFSQVFFPQEMDVRLSIVPDDERPALLDDSMSLPPIDLTLSPDAYESIGVLALVPVPRDTFAALKAKLPETPLVPILQQVLANRSPLQLLRLYQGALTVVPVPPVANTAWASAIGTQKFGYYVRRRTQSTFVPFGTPTGVTLTSSANPSVVGQAVTFQATVSPNTATGSITFLDGVTPLGTAPINAGVATLSVSTLSAGAHSITANYPGDGTHAADTSAPLAQAVKAAASVTLASSTNPSNLQQAVTFTATVTPNSATGTVQFRDGATVLGPATIAAGTAKLTISTLTAGTHPITAAYGGDDKDAASVSAPLAQTVRAVSSVALASSLNPSAVGQAVTFTAKVTPATATGSVQFRDGATVLGTGTLGGGTAALTISTLPAGVHSITAAYSGDGATAASTSAPLTQTVRAGSAVALTSSVNPSNAQQPVGFTATVTPSTATGSVQFLDGSTPLGTGTLSGGAANLPVSTLTPGTHSITATYAGDAGNAPGISPALAQVVKALTNVILTSSVNPSNPQQAVVFTATVTPIGATGSVQFRDGTTPLGTGTLSGGVATLSVGTLLAGSHSITAVYAGDASNATSTSAPLVQTVRAASSVALSSSMNPSNVQQAVTFTATLTPKTGTGNVQFLDGTTAIGTGAPSAGSATLTISTLAAGVHSITAAYQGDGNTAASASAALAQTVRAGSSVALASSVNPSNPQQAVTLTATLTPKTATGSVQFLDGPTSLGTGTLSAGVATLPVSTLAAGAHSITAAYGGDGSNAAATSAPLVQTVRAASSTTLAASPNPSNFQQAVTLTATVTPKTATGTVAFQDGSATPAPVTVGTGTLSGGVAAVSVSTLAAGVHAIIASYAGDGNDTTSASTPLLQTVRAGTSVTLVSSANPSNQQQAVTFTATVNPKNATGNIQFLDGANALGAIALNGGAASISVSTLAAGAHTITAAYGGDGANAPSASAPLAQTVRSASTVGLSSSVNPSSAQQAVAFTATVTPKAATGSVQFLDGTAALGSQPLSAGVATVQTATLAAGAHSITAAYAGDGNTTPATSVPLTQNVKAQASIAVVSSANPSNPQQAVTFTATVNPKSATGSVAFLDGVTGLGSVVLAGGVASLTVTTLAAGTHLITVLYGGDTNTLGGVSIPVAQIVRSASSVALTASPNPSNLQQAVTLKATVNPATATGTVTFQDANPTSPAPVTLGTGTVSGGSATLAIATLAAGTQTITAVYGGDANTSASTSPPVSQVVRTATGVTLTAAPNPASQGQAVALTARLAVTGATGTVQFIESAKVLGAAAVNTDSAAVFSISTLPAGTHSITAVYSGDAKNGPGSSAPLALVVNVVLQ